MPDPDIPSLPPPPPERPSPQPIPQMGRPLPVKQPPLPEETGRTPADLALEREGGEIIPEEFRPKAPEPPKSVDFSKVTPMPVEPAPAAPREEIKVDKASPVQGNPAPEPPPKSPEQVQWETELAGRINVELNIYHSCFQSTRRMVNVLLASMPADSADIGEGQWTGGKRTPLENAEPEIALEVYRQVRREMRQEVRDERDEVTRALKTLGFDPRRPRAARR